MANIQTALIEEAWEPDEHELASLGLFSCSDGVFSPTHGEADKAVMLE